MIRPIRRTVSAVAATGLLAAALTGCSLFGGGLGCSDLESAISDNNLDGATITSADPGDIRNLGQWMVDNGGDFGDSDLGSAVTTFGESIVPLMDLQQDMEDIDPSDPAALEELETKQTELEDASAELEAAANTIDDKCSGFSF